MLSRRGLFGLGAAGLLLPRGLMAGSSTGERKFIFVFCPGGWDTLMVFAPVFSEQADHEEGDEAATIGGFALTDSQSRPSVRSFFERWGSRVCLLNGLQVPSVAHDVCTRWTMTGNSRGLSDDWVSIIAGHSTMDRVLPNVHISGPIYPHVYVSASVRVGLAGQLPALITGDALLRTDPPLTAPTPSRDALEEAFTRARLDTWSGAARPGMASRVAEAEQLAMDRSAALPGVVDDLTVADSTDLYSALEVAVRALGLGLSRTGIVAYGAGGNGVWDTHSGNSLQAALYEELFAALGTMLDELDSTPGESAPTLLDETTVVVLSEMGRTPERNAAGGKDHWTWTSAMLIGAGVAGGRTIGAWTDSLTGEKVDLATGDVSASGETMLPGHLGATLLALADVDPGDFVDPLLGSVIEGVLE